MLYFKNVDLAETYHVSLRTVLNWIEAAKQGKLDLTLHTQNDKSYVANTARNIATIEKIVAERKKFRNTRGHKVVSPKPEFYELYDEQQIIDIISSIDIDREIPHKYSYFDGGAKYWDEYTVRMAKDEAPNLLLATQSLLHSNQGYIDGLIAKHKKVNILDIGVGNALPVRDLLAYVLDTDKLGRYVALDISVEMLELAKQNIQSWFGDRVAYEGYKLDINFDRFSGLLMEEYFSSESEDTLNLVLLLGGTLENFEYPDGSLRIIHGCMGRNDLLLRTAKLDTESSRQYFDFGVDDNPQNLFPQDKFIIDLLGIDDTFYQAEMGYDAIHQYRYIRIRLKVSITIEFTFNGRSKKLPLNKDDTLLLWRYWHHDAEGIIRQLNSNNFSTIQASQTEDEQFLLTIARIKSSVW